MLQRDFTEEQIMLREAYRKFLAQEIVLCRQFRSDELIISRNFLDKDYQPFNTRNF